MRFRYEKLVLSKKGRAILVISVLVLVVFMSILCQHNNFYTVNFLMGSLGENKDVQIAYRGEYTILTARMLNSSGYPIINELVIFEDLTRNLSIGGNYTNASGYAVLNWSITAQHPLGIIIIRATCPNVSYEIPVDIELLIKARTVFDNLTYTSSLYAGQELVVEVDLLDNNNSSISNKQVYLCDYQNVNLNESITDTFGHCKLFWRVPISIAPGQYVFKVKFEGDQLYDSTEKEFNVTIASQPTIPPIKIVSINLNSTRVKPNTLILVSVELNYSDPFTLVRVNNDCLLVNLEGNIWKGTINTPLEPGKYTINVFVFYNGTPLINDSSTYYIVEEETVDFPAVTLLPFLSNGESSFNRNISFAIFPPLSALSIILAVIAWKNKRRQPRFSKDYTLGTDLNSLGK